MDPSVTGAEETAQDPVEKADHDSGEEGGPESRHMESRDHLGNEQDEKGVDDQNEEAHRHNDEGKAQQQQHGPHQGVDDSQKEGGPQQRTRSIAPQAGNQPGSPENRNCGDKPAQEKLFHIPTLLPFGAVLAEKRGGLPEGQA